MENKAEITVLMTVYNGMPYLKDAVESTLNQTFDNFVFLIIDDCSTDDSLNYLESIRDERVKVFKNSVNLGQAKSLNIGLKQSHSTYIARLDQDDINLPTRLEGQISFMKKNKDISILSSYEYGVDENGKEKFKYRKDIKNFGQFMAEILLGICPVWHPSVMFKKEVLDKIGYYDERLGPAEDFDLWSRFALNREGAAIVKKFHLKQRNHDNRQSVNSLSKQIQKTSEIHLEILNQLLGECELNKSLNSFLLLKGDSSGKRLKSKHLKQVLQHFSTLKNYVIDKYNFSREEEEVFNKRLTRRLGLGIHLVELKGSIPNFIFNIFFYSLSPMFFIRPRRWVRKYLGNFLSGNSI